MSDFDSAAFLASDEIAALKADRDRLAAELEALKEDHRDAARNAGLYAEEAGELRAKVAELETDNKFLTELVEDEYGEDFRRFFCWVDDGKGGGYAARKSEDEL